MDILQAAALGIIEGVTEFLPVSSTGHLMLFSQAMGIEQTEFLKTFEIAIQFGAILAVMALYWERFLLDRESLKRVMVAFLPTGLIGFLLYQVVRGYLLESPRVVLWSLLLGGIFLIVFELLHRESEDAESDINRLSYRKCLLLGVFQAIAIIPGVSRSAATIFGGLWMGIRRKVIVEFSFLLAVVTMLAATGYDLLKNYEQLANGNAAMLMVGFGTSFVVAVISIKFLLSYIQKHSFIIFGAYRILAAGVFWWLIMGK